MCVFLKSQYNANCGGKNNASYPQRCLHFSPQNLWLCWLAWPRGLCSCKIMIIKWGNCPGLSQWIPSNCMSPSKWRMLLAGLERDLSEKDLILYFQDPKRLLDFREGERGQESQGIWVSLLETEKDKKTVPPLEPQEEPQPCPNFGFSSMGL